MTSKPQINDILKLSTINGIGSARIRILLREFGSADSACNASLRRLTSLRSIDRAQAIRIRKGYVQPVFEKQLEWLKKENIGLLTKWDDSYPPMLKACSDAPLFLFYRGVLPAIWLNTIGIVGTRHPTAYGKFAAAKLTAELSSNNICIASGFARGVDTIAHETCVRLGGQTIAVLGCGLDRIYPPENKRLYRELCEHQLLLSEYLFGSGPDAMNFPKRNRIISGLSRGVLVIEAGKKSGALITTNYALEQNREVFAVPGNINSAASEGTNALIRQGAKLVLSADDIFDELPMLQKDPVHQARIIPPNLDKRERRLLEELVVDPVHIDHLVQELEESSASILSRLLKLELMGLIRQLPGKRFMRI
ncbi:MAG: DNA-processing protein DprA [Calditrichia bacterium]